MQSRSSRPRLHPMTRRNRVPSWPTSSMAAVPMARFCGEIILASTPPEELAAPNRNGRYAGPPLMLPAAAVCNGPNSWLDPASVPVMVTPNQPTIGDRKAKKPPAWARYSPNALVCPENCITKASAKTTRMVRIAQLNWRSVRP